MIIPRYGQLYDKYPVERGDKSPQNRMEKWEM